MKNNFAKSIYLRLFFLSFFFSFFITSLKSEIYYSSPGNTFTLSNITFSDNVEIGPLTTIIIPFGVTVKLKSGLTITVGEGAKLVINGIVTYDENPTDVIRMGLGIFVKGKLTNIQPNIAQVINGQYPGNNPSANGVVIIDGGTIDHMKYGVFSSFGGIVYANNYTSINNYYGIYFSGNQMPLDLFVKANPSVIQNSTFIINEFWGVEPDNSIQTISGIKVIGIYGIKILNCNFLNNGTWLWDNINISGILSEEGGVIVRNSTFSNFNISFDKSNYFPIKLYSLLSHIGYKMNVEVSNNIFDNCIHGVFSQGVDLLQIKGNSFFAPINGPETNVDLDVISIEGCVGLKFENNNFNNYYWPKSFELVKIVDCGSFGNQIKGNNFTNCKRGITFVGNNRGANLKCNNFISPPDDFSKFISVYADPEKTPLQLRGIPSQGAIIANDINGAFLPGNTFNNECGDPFGYCDFSISELCPGIEYYTYSSVSNKTSPTYSSPNINIIPNIHSNFAYLNFGCASIFELPEVIQKRIEGIVLKNEVISDIDSFYSDSGNVISFLDRYIEGLDFDITRHFMDSSEDLLTDFLASDQNYQKKYLYSAHCLNNRDFEIGIQELDLLDTLGTNLELSTYKDYNKKLIELLHANELQDMTESDLSFFEQISNSSTPTASKAKVLLDRISSSEYVCSFAIPESLENGPIYNTLNISPNPVSDKIYFPDSIEIVGLDIYSINGTKVASMNFISQSNEVDISDLYRGVYFGILSKSDNTQTKFRFIKL